MPTFPRVPTGLSTFAPCVTQVTGASLEGHGSDKPCPWGDDGEVPEDLVVTRSFVIPDGELAERFSRSHPDVPVVQVPALNRDVHDLQSLREVGNALAGP